MPSQNYAVVALPHMPLQSAQPAQPAHSAHLSHSDAARTPLKVQRAAQRRCAIPRVSGAAGGSSPHQRFDASNHRTYGAVQAATSSTPALKPPATSAARAALAVSSSPAVPVVGRQPVLRDIAPAERAVRVGRCRDHRYEVKSEAPVLHPAVGRARRMVVPPLVPGHRHDAGACEPQPDDVIVDEIDRPLRSKPCARSVSAALSWSVRNLPCTRSCRTPY
jgi:hypothetical protein